jgi:nicotinamide-nucleotide amidase
VKAVILAIGSEIMQGFLTDTNSSYLAQEITALGVEVVSIIGVGDDLGAIIRSLNRALDDADIVVCTGGVGPTSDDLTREAVAAVLNETPLIDPELLETVQSFFTRRGSVMPERNAKQAWLIPSAESLANPMGTAPGWFVKHTSGFIVIMPGVPREMVPMWHTQAVPKLIPLLGGNAIVSTTLKTLGIGESAVEERLRHIIDRQYPVVSTYAKNDGVHVRILAISENGQYGLKAVQEAEAEVRAMLGSSVYGDLNISLPVAVLSPLKQTGAALAIWESSTGGQVAGLLLSDPDVSDVVIAAHTVRLEESVGTRYPREVTREHTENLLETSGATHAVGVYVRLLDHDDSGRFDAEITVAVANGGDIRTQTQKQSGRQLEVGRRASLLAAEKLREALLDPTFLLTE